MTVEEIEEKIVKEDQKISEYKADLALISDSILVIKKYNFSERAMEDLNKTFLVISSALKDARLYKEMLCEEMKKINNKNKK